MKISEVISLLDKLAPLALAQPGDNCGLLVGDPCAQAKRLLVALEADELVLDEARSLDCDTLLTHHPLLFSPVTSLVEGRPRETLLRRIVTEGRNLIAFHTNVDSAKGGLADIAAGELGLVATSPLEQFSVAWVKFVGFIPPESVEEVARAVFRAGAGRIGDYFDCAFSLEGTGWFRPGDEAHPYLGEVGRQERVSEIRWETVVPRWKLREVIAAYVAAHPYEEPAFDVYPVDDVLPKVGLGRVGNLEQAVPLSQFVEKVVETFGCAQVSYCGLPRAMISRAAVVPGSGRSLLEAAVKRADVLVTGDLTYHDAERAQALGLALINVPHGDLEWWAFQRWAKGASGTLAAHGVEMFISEAWASAWRAPGGAGLEVRASRSAGMVRAWIDGGSRGNPGLAAIGVWMEDSSGRPVEARAEVIGVTTNNVAEYKALLAALELAEKRGASELEVHSDSELLVKQLRGEYQVKSELLRPLYDEAVRRIRRLARFAITHVSREQNGRADALVNKALDEHSESGL
ncbi:MAG: Nif3-like dinuclear metal center hexameric protein [Thermoleophilia bacterium]|nr:Nif3-like dinuclear metal center hexameric protein [Thermoleophilia bacterium]